VLEQYVFVRVYVDVHVMLSVCVRMFVIHECRLRYSIRNGLVLQLLALLEALR